MPHEPAPYSLAPVSFPFRALAALAGRGRARGERDVALACFMAARLAAGVRWPANGAGARGSASPLEARAAGARRWYATLTIPAAVRVTCARLADTTVRQDPLAVSEALLAVSAAAAPMLDEPARDELRQLAEALRAGF